MASLVSLSKIDSPSGRGANALVTILSKSPFLRYLDASQAFELAATVANHKAIVAGSSLKNRAIGSAYSQTALTPPSNQTVTQARMGDSVKIDETYKRDAANGLGNIDAFLLGELAERLANFGQSLEVQLFKGTGASNQFLGLVEILDGTTDVPGFTDHKGVVNAGDYGSGDSFDLSTLTATVAAKFKEMMIQALSQVDNPTGIACNRSLYARMNSIADMLKLGGTSLDEFGFRVKTFDSIPLIVLADDAIALTEPDDAGTPAEETTSLYIMAPAEKSLSIITNSGLQYQDYDSPNSSQQNEEWYEVSGAWKIQQKNSIRRVRNIKL